MYADVSTKDFYFVYSIYRKKTGFYIHFYPTVKYSTDKIEISLFSEKRKEKIGLVGFQRCAILEVWVEHTVT